ncbi:MAG: hypothetical protein DMG81_06830 [Acidobacteria bacterium]|nr:MAG: hypothetical protein DMG81_06830 [Acidobacteriota bacterium]
MTGKRLFWISIIILELVLVYLLWHPHRDRPMRASHRTSPALPALRQPEPRQSEARRPEAPTSALATATHKPFSGTRLHGATRKASLIINAGLKSPEPLPPNPPLPPPPPLTPFESFWCHISTIDSNCDCKAGIENHDQTANLVMR